MSYPRNKLWNVHPEHPVMGGDYSYQAQTLSVLMDIRDELREMNGKLTLENVAEIQKSQTQNETTKKNKKFFK